MEGASNWASSGPAEVAASVNPTGSSNSRIRSGLWVSFVGALQGRARRRADRVDLLTDDDVRCGAELTAPGRGQQAAARPEHARGLGHRGPGIRQQEEHERVHGDVRRTHQPGAARPRRPGRAARSDQPAPACRPSSPVQRGGRRRPVRRRRAAGKAATCRRRRRHRGRCGPGRAAVAGEIGQPTSVPVQRRRPVLGVGHGALVVHVGDGRQRCEVRGHVRNARRPQHQKGCLRLTVGGRGAHHARPGSHRRGRSRGTTRVDARWRRRGWS